MTILPHNSVVKAIREQANACLSQWATKITDAVTAYYYDSSLDGDGDIYTYDDGSSETHFQVSEVEEEALNLYGIYTVILHETPDGFCFVTDDKRNTIA